MPKFIVTKHERVTFWAEIEAENMEAAAKMAEKDEDEGGQPLDWNIDEEEVGKIDVEEVT